MAEGTTEEAEAYRRGGVFGKVIIEMVHRLRAVMIAESSRTWPMKKYLELFQRRGLQCFLVSWRIIRTGYNGICMGRIV